MAKVSIEWEHNIPENAKKIIKEVVEGLWSASELAVNIIGNKANEQVPLDIGTLSRSWSVEPLSNDIGFRMGFHTKYAARLHEHPEYRFQNGRKAKYLEDPIEQNLGDWQNAFLSKLKEVMK